MRILLVGGGSGGPVAPLLAVAETLKQHHAKAEFLLVGTFFGPEKLMAGQAGINFVAIPAGKWRRYFSLKNFAAPFEVAAGFFKSLGIIRKFKPDCLFAGGSFVQVPVCWAAFFLGVPVVLHQQDIVPSLANRLCQLVAKKITVTFADSAADFYSGSGLFYHKRADKVLLTGNPFRQQLHRASREEGQKFFGLEKNFPTLLVLGGGTGAQFLNQLVTQNLPELTKVAQIIHSTGPGKFSGAAAGRYHAYEFISHMGLAYAAADIVLCRAGLSTLTELSNLKKVSIIVPLPGSHQEFNAGFLARYGAALVAPQGSFSVAALLQLIRRVLLDGELQKQLQENISKIMPHSAHLKIAEIIAKEVYADSSYEA